MAAKSKKASSKKASSKTYSTTGIAKNAVNQFANSLKYRDGTRMAVNSLNEYAGDAQLRQDYSPFTNYDAILGNYNTASDAAYDLARAEQIQAMNAAEDQNYSNTKSAIQQMRQALAGSASSGANQALLGLGQQNANATTAGMQGYQNTAKEAAAARAQNAVTALEAAKSGVDSMYGQATSAYNSDHLYGSQGIADAAGTIASAIDTNASSERANAATNASNERMNNATNKTNLKVAKTHTKQTIYNKK